MTGLLHDEAGQFLALAHLALADLARAVDDENKARVLDVRGYLDEVEKRLRDASDGLAPGAMPAFGLVDALRFLATACERRSGIPVTVESMLDLKCPVWVESLIYAFVRDALSRVGEHARVSHARVILSRSSSGCHAETVTVCCAVQDDGLGLLVEVCEIRATAAATP